MSNQRKTYKSSHITKEYERQHYKEWRETSQSAAHEFFGALHWFLGLVFPLLVAVYFVLNENTLSWSEHIALLSTVFWIYPFEFVCSHVYVHMLMLENYNNDIIFSPWAYYHHYVDSMMYSKYPYNYRKVYLEVIFFVNVSSLVFALTGLCPNNIDFCIQVYIVAVKMFLAYTDVVLHEWYHTFDSQYTEKYNIFSAKFIGVHMYYQALQRLGFADKTVHKKHHDPSSSVEMEDTKEWLDLNVGAGWLADKYGTYSYVVYIWIHHNILNGARSHIFLLFWALQKGGLQYVTLCAVSGLFAWINLYGVNDDESQTRSRNVNEFNWSYADIRVNILLFNAIIWIVSKLYLFVRRRKSIIKQSLCHWMMNHGPSFARN